MGQKQKRIRQTEIARGLGRRTNRIYIYIYGKRSQTGSLDIPDRGETTSEIPRPTFWVLNRKQKSVFERIFRGRSWNGPPRRDKGGKNWRAYKQTKKNKTVKATTWHEKGVRGDEVRHDCVQLQGFVCLVKAYSPAANPATGSHPSNCNGIR